MKCYFPLSLSQHGFLGVCFLELRLLKFFIIIIIISLIHSKSLQTVIRKSRQSSMLLLPALFSRRNALWCGPNEHHACESTHHHRGTLRKSCHHCWLSTWGVAFCGVRKSVLLTVYSYNDNYNNNDEKGVYRYTFSAVRNAKQH